MDKLVSRVTVIQRSGDDRQATTVFHKPKKKGGPKSSSWARPLERAARRLVQANITFGQELLRRHDEASRRRRDGWLTEGPENIKEASRKAYNEVRKGVPFRLLPKR